VFVVVLGGAVEKLDAFGGLDDDGAAVGFQAGCGVVLPARKVAKIDEAVGCIQIFDGARIGVPVVAVLADRDEIDGVHPVAGDLSDEVPDGGHGCEHRQLGVRVAPVAADLRWIVTETAGEAGGTERANSECEPST